MTARLEMRQAIRRRLGDTGLDPVWDDAFLNDAINEAVRRYSTRIPRQVSTTIAVTVGDRELTIPPTVNAMKVVRLFDDLGELWRYWSNTKSLPPSPIGRPGNEFLWRAWAGELLLDTPAPRTGFWRVEHEAHRVVPVDDVTPMDFQVGDDDLIIANALAVSLNRRAIQDGKRYTGKSGVHPMAAAARIAQNDADRLFGNRLRAVRVTT